MNATLPVEIQGYADEMKKQLDEYMDNLGAMRIEEAKENEKGFRDIVVSMIKWYISQNASEEKLTDLKETLVVNLYRLKAIRKVVENQNTIGEAKLIFQQLGII
jgi:hypothetical protein